VKYKVLRRLRWRGKNYERGEILIPKSQDEAYRCEILSETGTLAPIVSDALLKNLQSAGVRVGQRVQAVSRAFDDVKQQTGGNENGE